MNRLHHIYSRADVVSRGFLGYVIIGLRRYGERDSEKAAALAYYAILSLFPLVLLLGTVTSRLFGPELVQDQALKFIQRFFPGDTQALIVSGVQSALAGELSLNLMAAVGLLWAASSLFSNLAATLDTIFHMADRPRPMWRKRLLAVGMIVMLSMLLGGTFAVSFVLRSLGQALLEYPGILMRFLSLVLPLSLDFAILSLLFRFVPQGAIRWRAIWIAALLGGVGWEGSRALFVWYLDNLANYNLFYGSLGSGIALLIWIYFSAAILLLSAELCVALNEWLAAKESNRDG